MITDDEHYFKLNDLITSLAKRINPKAYYWFTRDCDDNSYDYYNLCNICLMKLHSEMSILELRTHGINHLKERNLLPFI